MSAPRLSDTEYLEALKRQRARIALGTPLVAYDDNTLGDKSMGVTWGLCSEDREAWPTPELHLWPDQFAAQGRIAPRYREDHHTCPFDTRGNVEPGGFRSGCFYTCMVFQAKHKTPTREIALKLYDTKIAEIERRLESKS